MKITITLLIASLIVNIYLLSKLYRIETTDQSITLQKLSKSTPAIGTIYQEECPTEVTISRICKVELVERRSDFAMIKIHYHYKKGEEGSNRIVVKANNGSHDNTVGTRSAHHLVEGSNTIHIPFGLYSAEEHQEGNPYISEYIVIRAKGISEDSKLYITPHLFEAYIKYKKSWYAVGEKTSWHSR